MTEDPDFYNVTNLLAHDITEWINMGKVNGTPICSHSGACESEPTEYKPNQTKIWTVGPGWNHVFNQGSSASDVRRLDTSDRDPPKPQCIQFSFSFIDVKGKTSKDRTGWKRKNRRGGRRNRKRNRSAPEKQKEEDPCPGDFVSILELSPQLDLTSEYSYGDAVNASVSAPHVLLDKTCRGHDPPATITSHSNLIYVIFHSDEAKQGKGFKLDAKTVNCSVPSSSSCLGDCEWKENPFYQLSSLWRFGGWRNDPNDCDFKLGKPSIDDTGNCTRVQFTTPKIPKDLKCLDDCFYELDKEYNHGRTNEEEKDRLSVIYNKKCNEARTDSAGSIFDLKANASDAAIDCILFNKVDDTSTISLSERRCIIPKSKILAMAGGLGRDIDLDKDRNNGCDSHGQVKETEEGGRELSDILINNFVPKEPIDLALMFCIMAHLDSRRKLPSIDKTAFYKGERVWRNTRFRTCRFILPRFDKVTTTSTPASGSGSGRGFVGRDFRTQRSLKRSSITRSTGPASANIER